MAAFAGAVGVDEGVGDVGIDVDGCDCGGGCDEAVDDD